MAHSPSWEAFHFSVSQEIPHSLWNQKFHNRFHKCPPPVPILSQLDPLHIPTSYFLKIRLKIILPSKPGSSNWSLSLDFPTKTLYTLLLSPIRATCPAQIILLDFNTPTILGEEYRSYRSPLCSYNHSSDASFLLGPNILLSTHFSDNLSLRSSLNVNDQVSHPYNKTGRIIVLYILIFKFLDSKPDDKTFCTEWY